MPLFLFFFFKQKTAYEMRISDWSSDVCSSDLWRILCTTGAQSGDLSLHDLISTGSPDHAAAAIGGDAPFIQIYTSGTTGVPKGVVVPVRALASFRVYAEFALDLRPDDVFWNSADPGWGYGLYFGVLAALTTGCAGTFDRKSPHLTSSH